MMLNFNKDIILKTKQKTNINNVFFTSDLHFFHKNIMSYCPNRLCPTVEEMNRKLITNWNAKIKPSSYIFVLGDVIWGKSEDKVALLRELNGIKILIPGNHDIDTLKKETFKSIWDFILPELSHLQFYNYFLVLCHFPLASWMFRERNSIHLHGHCHGTLKWDQSSGNVHRIDVGVDNHPLLSPWSFVELLDLIEQRQSDVIQ